MLHEAERRRMAEETLTYCDFSSEHWPPYPYQQCQWMTKKGDLALTRMVGSFSYSHASLYPAAPRSWYPEEVHEHEAPGDCHKGCPHYWLTSFTPGSANQFAQNSWHCHVDTTVNLRWSKVFIVKFANKKSGQLGPIFLFSTN